VKRALKSGDLIRIKRGLYVLADRHRTTPVHPYALAQGLIVGSYVSMETALAFHGWIPEAVYTTVSVTPGRKSKTIDHKTFGRFEFNPLALKKSGFLAGVDRHVLSEQAVLVASPPRALMDLVAYRKQSWAGLSWIETSLRIDRTQLYEMHPRDFTALKDVYKHKVTNAFLDSLQTALREMRSNQGSRQEGAVQ
jgi:predicted transcriptional regulator of viral defense system